MIVDIDEAQLDREFDARLATLGPAPLEGEVLSASDAEWQRILRKFRVADKLHHSLVPAWEVDQEDKDAVTGASAEILNTLWPGGIANIDHWSPWAKLGFVLVCIAAANFDDETMSFRPTHPPEPPKPPEQKPNAEE